MEIASVVSVVLPYFTLMCGILVSVILFSCLSANSVTTVIYQSQSIHMQTHYNLIYCLIHYKWDRNSQNEHHGVLNDLKLANELRILCCVEMVKIWESRWFLQKLECSLNCFCNEWSHSLLVSGQNEGFRHFGTGRRPLSSIHFMVLGDVGTADLSVCCSPSACLRLTLSVWERRCRQRRCVMACMVWAHICPRAPVIPIIHKFSQSDLYLPSGLQCLLSRSPTSLRLLTRNEMSQYVHTQHTRALWGFYHSPSSFPFSSSYISTILLRGSLSHVVSVFIS